MQRDGPESGRATEQRDELAPFQLIELHSVPCQAPGLQHIEFREYRSAGQCTPAARPPNCRRDVSGLDTIS
jgi:hypothetical protein